MLFRSVVVVSLYQHWLPLLSTIAFVALHHAVLGTVDPGSVINHPDAIAHPWRWAAIHAGFILAESVAAVYAWRHSELAQIEAREVTEHLVAEHGRLERQTAVLALLESVAAAANEASSVDDAVDLALAAVCSYTGWPTGHAYLVADTSDELVDTGIWRSDGSRDMDQFKAASRQARLVTGVGLAGRVRLLARATWIADLASDPEFARKEAAAAAGLVSACAFPILAGTDVAGVLEFFADDHLIVGEEYLALMDQVGTQLGRVVERHRATASLRTSEDRVRSIVETASDAFISMDAHGVVTDWNRQAEATFGWSAAEALGRPVADLIVPEQHRAAYAGGLERFLSTGDGPVLGRRVELTALRRDGSEFPVELAAWATGSGEKTVFNAFVQDISERVRAQHDLEQAFRSASEAVGALERRNREMTLMGEMRELLQNCETMEETYEVISPYATQAFGNASGAVYVLAPSHNTVERVASWGAAVDDDAVFAPSACWGLRRGRLHAAGPTSALVCGHLPRPSLQASLCIPMVAQSEALGVLHLRRDVGDGEVRDEDWEQLAVAMAEHFGLALANQRLRQSLRSQSIRDPLTGLYNRRYLDEFLERELRRLSRASRPLSVVSIDVDHFKQFNDNFGHSAGDAVLAALGQVLLENVRGEDIACRMGGEELLVILPDCASEAAVERAEELRVLVRNLSVEHQGHALGRITISIGVATSPVDGSSGEALLLASDAALYSAKAQGRDRTLVHGS